MISFPGRGIAQRAGRRTATEVACIGNAFRRYDVSIFHDFAPPPAGGGHQFLRALKREWERMGVRVEVNRISRTTCACLFNSYNFDPVRLRRMRRPGCRFVHRVDGPLKVYRGSDDGTDNRIEALNRLFADATILQSAFSLQAHADIGLALVDPVVIPNAADPELFFPSDDQKPPGNRKLRLISTSWSDNANKGADVYAWLDQHLDFSKYEYTFAGRSPVQFEHIRHVAPLPSAELADLLRSHDVYITASRHDPCSNSLIEALACGLPVIYRNSGGHPELAGEGGLAFEVQSEIPDKLALLGTQCDAMCAKLPQYDIRRIADAYLRVLIPDDRLDR